MCLIVLSNKVHPQYKLVIAANRDEFYDRPSRPAAFWNEEGLKDMIAGKDLKAGGTWFGVNKNGNWAAITNYRNPNEMKIKAPSRGEIVRDFLADDIPPADFLSQLQKQASEYNGFNLLIGNSERIYNYNNINNSIIEVENGIHGLSNAFLNSNWPKTIRAKNKLSTIMESGNLDKESLFMLLKDEKQAPENKLPKTGLSRELEKMASPIFIKSENYGTRCSTILLIGYDNHYEFIERSYKPGSSEILNEQKFEFNATNITSEET